MIIYNITTKIAWHIHDEWKEWLLNVQLPSIMATGFFEQYQLVRLLEVDDEEGPTYALQLRSSSIENVDSYRYKHLDEVEQQERNMWGNDLISFRSLMQVIN
jgi:hypothetical protein